MIVCETVGLRAGSRFGAVERHWAANMGRSQRCGKQIVRTSVKPKMRHINNFVLEKKTKLMPLFSRELERTVNLGSMRTALAGPMTRARRAAMIIQNTTKALGPLADALQSQTHVALEQKKSNLEKVKPELTRPSGKPSPCSSWCRMISKTIVVILAIARSSCHIQLVPSGRHGHEFAKPVLLQRREMLQESKSLSMTRILTQDLCIRLLNSELLTRYK